MTSLLYWQVGFSANGSMAHTDDGPTVDLTVTLEMANYPNITFDISHETKGPLEFKTTGNLLTGKHSINAISYATTAVRLLNLHNLYVSV